MTEEPRASQQSRVLYALDGPAPPDLILWHQSRREVAAQLLGLPVDQVTRGDLLWANLRFGRPPLAHEAPGPRWRREALSPPREA